MTARTTPRPTAPLALALSLALAACGTATPTAAPSPTAAATQPAATPDGTPRPAAEIYAEIRTAVEKIRGLQPTATVDPVTIDETTLRANLEAEFDATHTPAQLKVAEDELITLGLLPKGSSIRELTSDFQSGQVAGYYSPEKDRLFIVNRTGTLGPADEVTYSHEFTHQLQDQHFKLDALDLDAPDQSDRSFARLALVEGDAVSVQSSWMIANLDSKQLGQLLGAALDPEALAALNRAPAYLRETVAFGYQDGLGFVTRLLADGGYTAVNAAFADPPDSTEQILHAEKYLTREAPVRLVLPADLAKRIGSGWSEVGQDTLGELLIRTWLKIGGQTNAQATDAADGWGGDRLAVYRGPDGKVVVVLVTAWDTPGDAAQFAQAVDAVKGALGKPVIWQNSTYRVALAVGDASALEALAGQMDGLLAQAGGS